MATACCESDAWINDPSIAALSLCMSDDVVKVAGIFCLGVPWCSTHKCSCCGADVNVFGAHGLSCPFSKGHHLHHASFNDITQRSLGSAKVPCLVILRLLAFLGQRAGDNMVLHWLRGKASKSLCWTGPAPVLWLLPMHLWQ